MIISLLGPAGMQIFISYRRTFLRLPSILGQSDLKRKFRANNSIQSKWNEGNEIIIILLLFQTAYRANTRKCISSFKNKAIISFAYNFLKTSNIENEWQSF